MNTVFSPEDEAVRAEVQSFLESAMTDDLKEAGRKKTRSDAPG